MLSNLGSCFVSLISALPKLMLGRMGASLISSRYKRFHSYIVSTVTSPVYLITAHLAGTGEEEGRSLYGSQALVFSGSPDWASLSFSYQGYPCVFALPSWALLGASPAGLSPAFEVGSLHACLGESHRRPRDSSLQVYTTSQLREAWEGSTQ